MNVFFPVVRLAFAAVLAAVLAGCASSPAPQPIEPARPQYTSPITAQQVVGKWGLAAYHRPDDAARTEAQARQGCRQPYVINAGPSGGFMMYLADDAQPSEVISKQVGNGPIYIGLADEPPGAQSDREVVRFDGQILVLKWVDQEVAGRYGTMVYVRCP
ncbi:hypothetical protein KHC23_00500 [Ancylobacter dichloromethanicus]|uniref:Lipoprotein n=1 Tax=Ancylobacter dichloromethanicus TaxID=518825 RepID=A0A9W6N154_9HYPH|nr:hypothetical protein [Ancylobacter dichloromethanicus]MBS7552138.1 hypothetical protein [Ancylobacter dichloromethanicus]GLK73871.1 hypothetical protein GCM10017643_39890 [Ancylobacter dichloromethanicus]